MSRDIRISINMECDLEGWDDDIPPRRQDDLFRRAFMECAPERLKLKSKLAAKTMEYFNDYIQEMK